MIKALGNMVTVCIASGLLMHSPTFACETVDRDAIFAPADSIFVGSLTDYELLRSAAGKPLVAVFTYHVDEPLRGEFGDTVRLSWAGAPWGEGLPERIQTPSSEIVGAVFHDDAGRKNTKLGLFTDGCGERYSVRATQENVSAIKHWINTGEVMPIDSAYGLSGDTIALIARSYKQPSWAAVLAGIVTIIGLLGLVVWHRRRLKF